MRRTDSFEEEYGILNVYLFPYIHPSVIRAIWPDETVSNWTDAMSVLIGHADVDPKARNIAVAHQFVTAHGVRPEECDSEQKHIGGLDNVEYSVFDSFDYVALDYDNARTRALGVSEAVEEALEKSPVEVLEELYSKQNGVGMTDFQKRLAASLIDEIWNTP